MTNEYINPDAGTDRKLLAQIHICIAECAEMQKDRSKGTRERALALTKLEEAALWLEKNMLLMAIDEQQSQAPGGQQSMESEAVEKFREDLAKAAGEMTASREKVIKDALRQGYALDKLVWCRHADKTNPNVEELRTESGKILCRFETRITLDVAGADSESD